MSGKRRRKSGRRFIQLYSNVKRSKAYHDCSLYARCALIELMDRYNGINNGMIGLGVRELAHELKCHKDTAAKALSELDDIGLAHPMTHGQRIVKTEGWQRLAVEWRLTFYRCDKTGEPPISNFSVRPDRTERPTKQDRGKKSVLPSRTDNPKNSINGSANCPTEPDAYRYTPPVAAQCGAERGRSRALARRRRGPAPRTVRARARRVCRRGLSKEVEA